MNILKEEYLDVYEGIQSEIISTTRLDENSDLSTMHIKEKQTNPKIIKLKQRSPFLYLEQGLSYGKVIRWNRMSNITRYGS